MAISDRHRTPRKAVWLTPSPSSKLEIARELLKRSSHPAAKFGDSDVLDSALDALIKEITQKEPLQMVEVPRSARTNSRHSFRVPRKGKEKEDGVVSPLRTPDHMPWCSDCAGEPLNANTAFIYKDGVELRLQVVENASLPPRELRDKSLSLLREYEQKRRKRHNAIPT